ncbi:MAG TPA: DUF3300 domain-containing protein [Acetobacteraceae bacterium]|nr:DUF3300 domain-containing protein [Acetobacteraceae bacterium]
MRHAFAALVSISLVIPADFAWAETPPAAAPAAQEAAQYNPEQLDALLAPIALYPDPLLTQVLMAATYPLQIVEASRWRARNENKDLKGDDLAKALQPLSWDPSVKSLVPFPQVLEMMNQQLEWTQQLGYAVAGQQAGVMDSVQRLRRQAQDAGTLKTTEQQVVKTEAVVDDQGAPTPQQTIVIQPANPQVVYVPTYAPAQVYGTWPYPATPPVYLPPPPGYAIGTAFVSGLAFATGVAVVGSLWGWSSPRWGGYGGSINVNTNRYNNITVNNANRGNVTGNRWQPPARAPGRTAARPPGGPVGSPARLNGLPANAVGRPNVKVPAQAVNRPNIGGAGATRNAPRPGGATATSRATPSTPSTPSRATPTRTAGGAFGGVSDGARAGQFQQRGAQSRSGSQSAPRAGGARSGGARRGR